MAMNLFKPQSTLLGIQPERKAKCVVKYARFVMSNLFQICLGHQCLDQVCHLKQQLSQVCKLICDHDRVTEVDPLIDGTAHKCKKINKKNVE